MTSCDLNVSCAAECSRKSVTFRKRRGTREYVFASRPYGKEEKKNRSFCSVNFHSSKAQLSSEYQFLK